MVKTTAKIAVNHTPNQYRELVTKLIGLLGQAVSAHSVVRSCQSSATACSGLVQLTFSSKKDARTYTLEEQWLKALREDLDFNLSSGSSQSQWLGQFVGVADKATKVVLTLNALFQSHFPSVKFHEEETLQNVLYWLPYVNIEEDWIALIKFQLLTLFAKAEDQSELPPKPSFPYFQKDGFPLSPRTTIGVNFYRWSFGTRSRNMMWRNTVLHGIKKGLPHMGIESVAKNLKKMKARLSTYAESTDEALEAIRMTVREIFPRVTYDQICNVTEHAVMSTNSCFENSRGGGGAMGSLLDNRFNPMNKKLSSAYYLCLNSELYRMSYCPMEGVKCWYWPVLRIKDDLLDLRRSVIFDKLSEDDLPSDEDEYEEEPSSPDYLFDSILTKLIHKTNLSYEIKMEFYNLQTRYREKDNRVRESRCKVHAILEPLKTRLITAGDLRSNCVWENLQQRLWSAMQNLPCLELTGRAVTVEDVEYILNSSGPEFDHWNSGDYEAATDNLHSDATLAAISVIAGDPIVYKIMARALVGTEISFDAFRKDEDFMNMEIPEDFTMERGQLMGCVFSFPLLCAINLAMYRLSIKRYCGHWPRLEGLPVRVNGDDILFRTDKELYEIWSETISEVGLIKSQGKNYFAKNTAIINSCYFSSKQNVVKMQPYFNGSFLTGVRKGSDDDNSVERHISNLRETEIWWGLDSLGRGLKEKYVNTFKENIFKFNEEVLCSWKLPLDHELGGLRINHEQCKSDKKNLYRLWRINNCPKPVPFGCPRNSKTMVPWKLIQASRSSLPDELALQREFSSYLREKRVDLGKKIDQTKTAKLIQRESFKILNREWVEEPRRDLMSFYRWSD